MNIRFTPGALEDFNWWKDQLPEKAERIKKLLVNIMETPFSGSGKPEPLLYELSGYWSRRIDREHRLVYRIDGDNLIVISCRYHYQK